MRSPITLDGKTYPHIYIMSLKRSFSVLDGENAGRVMTGDMDRDVIGTFYNYSAEIEPSELAKDEYDEFWEVVSAPVNSHKLVFPYAQGTIEFDAYVTTGSDNLELMGESFNRWGGMSLNFIAMAPYRRPAE